MVTPCLIIWKTSQEFWKEQGHCNLSWSAYESVTSVHLHPLLPLHSSEADIGNSVSVISGWSWIPLFWLIMCSLFVFIDYLLMLFSEIPFQIRVHLQRSLFIFLPWVMGFLYQKITYLNSKVFITTFPSTFIWCEQLFMGLILLQVFNYFLFF